MFKIRNYCAFFLLLSLFIGCDLKSPLLRGEPISSDGLSSSGQIDDSLIIERDIMRDEIGDKINSLINSFGLMNEEKEVLSYIRSVVTMNFFNDDDKVLKASSYKTYNEDEFYDLLINLGVDRVRDIIGRNLFVFTLLKEAEKVMKGSKPGLKRDHPYALKNVYISYLREAFSGDTYDEVYYKAINNYQFSNNYAWRDDETKSKFIAFSLPHVIAVEKIYEELSLDEKRVFNYIKKVAADPLCGGGRYLEMYTNIDLHFKLGRLGVKRVKELIEHVGSMQKMFDVEIQKKIDSVVKFDKDSDFPHDFKYIKQQYASELHYFIGHISPQPPSKASEAEASEDWGLKRFNEYFKKEFTSQFVERLDDAIEQFEAENGK
ncbi:BTA121 domain-containing protein surface lipoprotein [Borrelia crocidurae]|uniref:Lipoprotein n=1 Tax=Borrelia crocidurae (strain Achema) TaxID=1155096 RepID=I0FFJ4_BORCA|nr:hypothetical protein [Borrelia crocidurae]AFI32250.1 hypothetical protein Q7M_1424 [Borrelia crocidurae str. Achema]